MARNDRMYVVRQNRASPDRYISLRDKRRETPTDCPSLPAAQPNGWVLEEALCRQTRFTPGGLGDAPVAARISSRICRPNTAIIRPESRIPLQVHNGQAALYSALSG